MKHIRDRNVWVVYASVFLLGIAYGVAIALTALHLDERGFSKQDIGTLAAWFASGIVALSLPMGGILRRFSARGTLAVCMAGYAGCVTLFPFLRSYPVIGVARFFDGAFSVGIWVSAETILLSRSDRDNKAFITSLYAIAIAVGYVVGPLLARVIAAFAPLTFGFVFAGALALVASAVAALLLDADVPELHGHHDDGTVKKGAGGAPMALLRRIKTSCFGTFAYGYFQSSVVLFLPLYLMEAKGIEKGRTIVIPAFFAAGMLLFSNVAGRLADRLGHLLVMRWLTVTGGAMVAAFVVLDRFEAMAAAVFVAGACLGSISPVSLALQGVVTEPWNYSRSNALYNAFYAAGMLLGPPVSSLFFQRMGGAGMLIHLAALWAAFFLFAWVFAKDDPAANRSRPAAGALPLSQEGGTLVE